MQKKLATIVEATYEELVNSVRDNLTPDLLQPRFREAPFPMGHCYVAAEAIYHLAGGKESGLKPMRLRMPDGVVHWWLQAPDGEVIDPTHDQFDHAVPYAEGKAGGFLTRDPSKRARELMSRISKTASIIPVTGMPAHDNYNDGRRTFVYIIPTDHLYLADNNGYHNDLFRYIYEHSPEDTAAMQDSHDNISLGLIERNYEDHALEVRNYWAEGEKLPDNAIHQLEQHFGERIFQRNWEYPVDWTQIVDTPYDENDYDGGPTAQWPTGAEDQPFVPYTKPLKGYEQQRESSNPEWIHPDNGRRKNEFLPLHTSDSLAYALIDGQLYIAPNEYHAEIYSWLKDHGVDIDEMRNGLWGYYDGKDMFEHSDEFRDNNDHRFDITKYLPTAIDITKTTSIQKQAFDNAFIYTENGDLYIENRPHPQIMREHGIKPGDKFVAGLLNDSTGKLYITFFSWSQEQDVELYDRAAQAVEHATGEMPTQVSYDEMHTIDITNGGAGHRHATTIKNVEFEQTQWGGGREMNSQPLIYDPSTDTLYVGPNEASHAETMRNIPQFKDVVEGTDGSGWLRDPRIKNLGFGEVYTDHYSHIKEYRWFLGEEPIEALNTYVGEYNAKISGWKLSTPMVIVPGDGWHDIGVSVLYWNDTLYASLGHHPDIARFLYTERGLRQAVKNGEALFGWVSHNPTTTNDMQNFPEDWQDYHPVILDDEWHIKWSSGNFWAGDDVNPELLSHATAAVQENLTEIKALLASSGEKVGQWKLGATINWVDTTGANYHGLGLPFLYDSRDDTIYFGTTESYHKDLLRRANITSEDYYGLQTNDEAGIPPIIGGRYDPEDDWQAIQIYDFGDYPDAIKDKARAAVEQAIATPEMAHYMDVAGITHQTITDKSATADMSGKVVVYLDRDTDLDTLRDHCTYAHDPHNDIIYVTSPGMWHTKLIKAIGQPSFDKTWDYGWINDEGEPYLHNSDPEKAQAIAEQIKTRPMIYYNSRLSKIAATLNDHTNEFESNPFDEDEDFKFIYDGHDDTLHFWQTDGPDGYPWHSKAFINIYGYDKWGEASDDPEFAWGYGNSGGNQVRYGIYEHGDEETRERAAQAVEQLFPGHNFVRESKIAAGLELQGEKAFVYYDGKVYLGMYHRGIVRNNRLPADECVYGTVSPRGKITIYGADEDYSWMPLDPNFDPRVVRAAVRAAYLQLLETDGVPRQSASLDPMTLKDKTANPHVWDDKYNLPWNGDHWRGGWIYDPVVDQLYTGRFHGGIMRNNRQLLRRQDIVYGHFTNRGAEPVSFEYEAAPTPEAKIRGVQLANQWYAAHVDQYRTAGETVPISFIPDGWDWYTSWLYIPELDKLLISSRRSVNHATLMKNNRDLWSEIRNHELTINPGLIVISEPEIGSDGLPSLDSDDEYRYGIVPLYSDEFEGQNVLGDGQQKAIERVREWAAANTNWGNLEIVEAPTSYESKTANGIQVTIEPHHGDFIFVYDPASNRLIIAPYNRMHNSLIQQYLTPGIKPQDRDYGDMVAGQVRYNQAEFFTGDVAKYGDLLMPYLDHEAGQVLPIRNYVRDWNADKTASDFDGYMDVDRRELAGAIPLAEAPDGSIYAGEPSDTHTDLIRNNDLDFRTVKRLGIRYADGHEWWVNWHAGKTAAWPWQKQQPMQFTYHAVPQKYDDMASTRGFHEDDRVPFFVDTVKKRVLYGQPDSSHGEVLRYFPFIRQERRENLDHYVPGEWTPQGGISSMFFAMRLPEDQKAEIDQALRAQFGGERTASGQIMYHVAYQSSRQSIQQNGLEPADPGAGDPSPVGVYLFDNEKDAQWYMSARADWGLESEPQDIWIVNAEGLDLQPDPVIGHGAWYTPEHVDPDRVRLLNHTVGEHTAASKPILFLDVDGVLLPYGSYTDPSQHEELDFEDYTMHKFNSNEALHVLAPHYDIVWATSWNGMANTIGQHFGLPELPYVEIENAANKFPDLVAYAGERRWAWVDDSAWDEQTPNYMTVHISPVTGLTMEYVPELLRFSNSVDVDTHSHSAHTLRTNVLPTNTLPPVHALVPSGLRLSTAQLPIHSMSYSTDTGLNIDGGSLTVLGETVGPPHSPTSSYPHQACPSRVPPGNNGEYKNPSVSISRVEDTSTVTPSPNRLSADVSGIKVVEVAGRPHSFGDRPFIYYPDVNTVFVTEDTGFHSDVLRASTEYLQQQMPEQDFYRMRKNIVAGEYSPDGGIEYYHAAIPDVLRAWANAYFTGIESHLSASTPGNVVLVNTGDKPDYESEPAILWDKRTGTIYCSYPGSSHGRLMAVLKNQTPDEIADIFDRPESAGIAWYDGGIYGYDKDTMTPEEAQIVRQKVIEAVKAYRSTQTSNRESNRTSEAEQYSYIPVNVKPNWGLDNMLSFVLDTRNNHVYYAWEGGHSDIVAASGNSMEDWSRGDLIAGWVEEEDTNPRFKQVRQWGKVPLPPEVESHMEAMFNDKVTHISGIGGESSDVTEVDYQLTPDNGHTAIVYDALNDHLYVCPNGHHRDILREFPYLLAGDEDKIGWYEALGDPHNPLEGVSVNDGTQIYEERATELYKQWLHKPIESHIRHSEQLELFSVPKVVHIPTPRKNDMQWRIPTMYNWQTNTVYYGDPDGHHRDLLKVILQEDLYDHGMEAVDDDPETWSAGWISATDTIWGGPSTVKWFDYGNGNETPPEEVNQALKDKIQLESHKEASAWQIVNLGIPKIGFDRDQAFDARWAWVADKSTHTLYMGKDWLHGDIFRYINVENNPEHMNYVKGDLAAGTYRVGRELAHRLYAGENWTPAEEDEIDQIVAEWVMSLPDSSGTQNVDRVSTQNETSVQNMLVQSMGEIRAIDATPDLYFGDPTMTPDDMIWVWVASLNLIIYAEGEAVHSDIWDWADTHLRGIPPDGHAGYIMVGDDHELTSNLSEFPPEVQQKIEEIRNGMRTSKIATTVQFVPKLADEPKINSDRTPIVWDSETDKLYYTEPGGLHTSIYKKLLGNPLHAMQVQRNPDLDSRFCAGTIDPDEVYWFDQKASVDAQLAASLLQQRLFDHFGAVC